MTTTLSSTGEVQLTTFHVGEMLLAIPIEYVQEINRNLELTPIPHAPSHVQGVINLRGEVTTLIDLRRVLGLPSQQNTESCQNLVVRSEGEAVGLWVDRVADIITVDVKSINPPPANVSALERQYFQGVYRDEGKIVVVLDVEEVLNTQD